MTEEQKPSPFQRDASEPASLPEVPDTSELQPAPGIQQVPELAETSPSRHAAARAKLLRLGRRPAPGGSRRPGSGPDDPRRLAAAIALAGLLLLAVILTSISNGKDAPEEVRLDVALEMIEDGKVEEAALNDDLRTLVLTVEGGDELVTGYPTQYGSELVEKLNDADVEIEVRTRTVDSPLMRLLMTMGPIVILGALMVYLLRKHTGGRASGDPRRNKAVDTPEVRLADVAGAHEAVEDLTDVVEFLRDPDRFGSLGATVPRGVLLVGPPGTGKTLIARAVAGEAGVPFFSLSGSDFVEMYVGVGASRIRAAFDRARKEGPAIVFIDEIDSIGKARGATANAANEERESTLNALLVEMDGFRDSNVIVIAATNRPDTLDEALLRPGRFDRHVTVAAPDRRGRRELFELYLGHVTLDPAVDITATADRLARRSPGMTGANVKGICNEAALIAAKAGEPAVTVEHLEAALERGALGRERRSAEVSERARRVTAWHEAGHTVAALVSPEAEDPERVSIVPRGQAGGVTWFGAPDDEHFITREQCRTALIVAFGGRAAEELILDGDFTQGAASDIAAATARAEKMVCEWGMSDLGMGRIDMDRLMGEAAERVRLEVASLLDTAMHAARVLVAEHRVLLDAVAEELLEQETLDRDDLARIVDVVAAAQEVGAIDDLHGAATA